VLSTLQRSTTLTLEVAKTFIQKYVSRQQSNAAQNMAKITQLQQETAELAERVRTKRNQPLVCTLRTPCCLVLPTPAKLNHSVSFLACIQACFRCCGYYGIFQKCSIQVFLALRQMQGTSSVRHSGRAADAPASYHLLCRFTLSQAACVHVQ
jgi:hypothetical protein